jgi:hypothetical protein
MSTPVSDSITHRLWLQVFGTCFTLVATLLLWTVLTPPFLGDLTRIGRLSETAFGPTVQTAVMDPALRVSSALDEADVLVIGDSFSAPLSWQTVLVTQGMKVATVHWETLGPVCTNLESMLRTQGFRGTAVVIESVERALDDRLDRSLACASRKNPHRLQTRRVARDHENAGAFGLNTRESLLTGLLTTLHTQRALNTDAPEVINRHDGAEEVRIQRLPDGCQHFSHRACDRGLFFAQDRTAPPFSPAMVARMKRLSARHPGLTITWLIVPNKTSVYLEPDRAVGIGALLESTGLGPDLFSHFVRLSRQTRDLYSPNDTHTSTEGYRVVGQKVLDWLNARAPTSTRCRTAPDSPTPLPAAKSACR